MKRFLRSQPLDGEAFDMTPVIDVVFLLIIFFMLVCQFIVAERFKVDVPERITSSISLRNEERILTLTVLPEGESVVYGAGIERLNVENAGDLPVLIAAAIDEHYRGQPFSERRTVRLRCDRMASFGQVRPVLEGIAKSCATDVDWAVRE